MSVAGTSALGGSGSRPLGIRKSEKQVLYGQVEWVPIPPAMSPKIIQGDIGEGGGQVIRYAGLLSVLGNIPLQLERIRAGKFPPGLRVGHLHTVVMLARLCNAKLAAAYIGSKGISMIPNASTCQDMKIDTKTSASVTLLAQAALPILLFSLPRRGPDGQMIDSSCLTLCGATDVAGSPPLDYFKEVFLPVLKDKFGIEASIPDWKRGFHPKGEGWLKLCVNSIGTSENAFLEPINITEPAGPPVRVTVKVFRSGGGFPSKSEEACMNAAKKVLYELKQSRYPDMRIIQTTVLEDHNSAYGDGLGILLTCQCYNANIASSGVGNPEVQKYLSGDDARVETVKEAERTGQQAAQELVDLIQTESPIDQYLQDQLVLYMALAQGRSKLLMSEPTVHTLTAIDVCMKMIDCRYEMRCKKVGMYLLILFEKSQNFTLLDVDYIIFAKFFQQTHSNTN
eukprot:TRINITY_DN9878_c0_g2_i1.p1 TRINITY_DN9878_c0_g2~~TRINITY_DN9878_c0_g2_i1.p1  ORF type:complete len:500 (-),score=52.99 TRINITY_DN9878_c0_g2_i1:384-1742(-)